jgi:hypothetical protein
MLDEIAAEGGYVSFMEGREPYNPRDVEAAKELGLLRVHFQTGASIDVNYELTYKARASYGLPPTLETQATNWMLDRVRWLWSSRDDEGGYRLSRGKIGLWLGFTAASVILFAPQAWTRL